MHFYNPNCKSLVTIVIKNKIQQRIHLPQYNINIKTSNYLFTWNLTATITIKIAQLLSIHVCTIQVALTNYESCTCSSDISAISSVISTPGSVSSYFGCCSYFVSSISIWSWTLFSWIDPVFELFSVFVVSSFVVCDADWFGFVLPYFSWIFLCLLSANLFQKNMLTKQCI